MPGCLIGAASWLQTFGGNIRKKIAAFKTALTAVENVKGVSLGLIYTRRSSLSYKIKTLYEPVMTAFNNLCFVRLTVTEQVHTAVSRVEGHLTRQLATKILIGLYCLQCQPIHARNCNSTR